MAKSSVKFKDSVSDFETIRGDIAARKFAPVYLLMGDMVFSRTDFFYFH